MSESTTQPTATGANKGARAGHPGGLVGFVKPYKQGQGFYTRLGTGIGATLVIAFTVYYLYTKLPAWTDISSRSGTLYGICIAVALVMAAVAWWLMNRPKNAQFLIETDQEMKKVNWTSWRELVGSTKVVILFMFFVAGMLFVYDLLFGWIFYLLNILKFPPFSIG